MSDEDSSRPAKMRKVVPTCGPSTVSDEFAQPLEWDSHANTVTRDEAAFFAGWCAARKKFSSALRQHFLDSQIKECEDVFSSLTFIFIRRKSVPAVQSPEAAHAPQLASQPWFCKVLHSLTLSAAPSALQFSEGVEKEMRQVLQNALLELTKVSDIWTFKKSQSDREAVLATLERLKDMGVCNIDGSDSMELQRCTPAAVEQVAEQVQRRCRDYATSRGLLPYINAAFEQFCRVWLESDVAAAVVAVLARCSQESPSPAIVRVTCCDDMFTLSLVTPHSAAQPSSAESEATAPLAAGDSVLLCPSFLVHRSRLELLRRSYTLPFESTSFYERVMACLLRYKAVFHPNGGNWQAAQPHGIFELWASRLGACIECFASPMNRNASYPRYYSAFGDVDSPFGSSGSFFDNPPESGVCFASPPFDNYFLSAATAAIANAARCGSGQVAYIVSLPDWKRGSPSHTCIEQECDRMDLPVARGGKCQYMVYNQGQITMNSAVAADVVGLQQSYKFGIRFYALGFDALKSARRVNYDVLQRDMRRVFESAEAKAAAGAKVVVTAAAVDK